MGKSKNAVNIFMIFSVLGIIFSGVSLQEVYAADGDRVDSVALEVIGSGGDISAFDKPDKNGISLPHNTQVIPIATGIPTPAIPDTTVKALQCHLRRV